MEAKIPPALGADEKAGGVSFHALVNARERRIFM
jgi:hypothetical protein